MNASAQDRPRRRCSPPTGPVRRRQPRHSLRGDSSSLRPPEQPPLDGALQSGFTPKLIGPAGERALLDYGIGLTNLVDRPTRAAYELRKDELRRGGAELRLRACRYRPHWIAILGVVAYRVAFGEPDAVVGLQRRTLCSSRVWVLPGPTGRNAHFPLPKLIEEFRRLRRHVRPVNER